MCSSDLLGIAWFFLVLSVTSSVVPLADVLVEHRLYLASWGIFVAIVAAGERAAARLRPRSGWAAALALAALWVALAVATHRRNAVWESSEALWRDAVAKSPAKGRNYLALGYALRVQGRFDDAFAAYVTGLQHARGIASLESSLLNGVGALYADTGRSPDAVAVFRLALEKAPTDPMLLGNLSSALLAIGDLDGADDVAGKAIRADTRNANAWNTIAVVRLERRDPAGALAAIRHAVEDDPDRGVVDLNLGRALAELGRSKEACDAWRAAIRLPLPVSSRADAERLLATRCGAL